VAGQRLEAAGGPARFANAVEELTGPRDRWRRPDRGCQIAAAPRDPATMTATRIDAAFDRIDDFLAVQTSGLTLDAVLCLWEAVGVDDDARARIGARMRTLEADGHCAATGSLLLGLLVGLFAGTERA
jgi:hypothetical protein